MKKTTYLIFGIFFVMLFSSLNIPVQGAISELTIEDFDSYSEGVGSGNNTYVSWVGDRGVTSTTMYASSPMSLKVSMTSSTLSTETIILKVNTSISGFEFSFRYSANNIDCYSIIKLYNDTDTEFVKFRLYHQSGEPVEVYDYNTWLEFDGMGSYNDFWTFGFQGNHSVGNPINYVYYYVKNDTGSIIDSVEKRWMSLNEYDVEQKLSKIVIENKDNDAGVSDCYFDDITIYSGQEISGEDEGEEYNIYFEIYDLETGELMDIYGYDFIGAEYPPFVRMEMYSDLWFGDYDSTKYYGSTITFSGLDLPSSGSWHWFNFTGISGVVILDNKLYTDSNNYLKVFPTQTLSIYITDVVSPESGYSNCKTCQGGLLTYPTELCTDKDSYVEGESINFRYKTPTMEQLKSVPFTPYNYYYLWIYDINNLHWLWGTTDGGVSQENWETNDYNSISLDGNYHTLQWKYNATGETGYKTVTGSIDEYKAYVGHGGGGFLGFDSILCGDLKFVITSGIFTPSGNITSVSPSSPELGQKTQITFDVNNNGYMTSRNLLAPLETEITITTFAKFIGSSHINHTFWDYGEYLITLYVSDGFGYTSVDTETLSITTLNGTYGGFGYNVEFLTCEPARVIAGFDTLFVNYRSLSPDGYILINDSRGQQTPYSTSIGVKTGVLNISIPNYAEIGEWNITLFGNSTLYSSFQVVAEENNWVEFYKNIFYDDEQFYIELKHDRKIEVVFYKDNVAYGRDWFLESGLLSSGIFNVPVDIAYPEIGDWKVEIWEVNNFIKIQKLAEDTCKVIDRPVDVEIVVDDDVAGYLSNIDPFYKGLIGIFIVLLCTFMPFIAIKKLGEHGVNFKVDIPPMLYTICCGVGAVVSLILGVWVIEYTFFICVMAGFGTFALYLMGKRGNGE